MPIIMIYESDPCYHRRREVWWNLPHQLNFVTVLTPKLLVLVARN